MKILNLLRSMSIVLMLTGCAVGQKIDLGTASPEIQPKGDGPLAVATVDRRPYIVSGDKPVTFVGLQRGGFGNPFDVHTASGQPLSKDVTDIVVGALDRSGYKTRLVETKPRQDKQDLLETFRGEGRSILLTITELKSDTYQNTAFHYNIKLEIFNSEGKVLATGSVEGKDNLGGSALNPSGHANSAVPPALEIKLESLLNEAEVANALQQAETN